jgi:hypothetical protein
LRKLEAKGEVCAFDRNRKFAAMLFLEPTVSTNHTASFEADPRGEGVPSSASEAEGASGDSDSIPDQGTVLCEATLSGSVKAQTPDLHSPRTPKRKNRAEGRSSNVDSDERLSSGVGEVPKRGRRVFLRGRGGRGLKTRGGGGGGKGISRARAALDSGVETSSAEDVPKDDVDKELVDLQMRQKDLVAALRTATQKKERAEKRESARALRYILKFKIGTFRLIVVIFREKYLLNAPEDEPVSDYELVSDSDFDANADEDETVGSLVADAERRASGDRRGAARRKRASLVTEKFTAEEEGSASDNSQTSDSDNERHRERRNLTLPDELHLAGNTTVLLQLPLPMPNNVVSKEEATKAAAAAHEGVSYPLSVGCFTVYSLGNLDAAFHTEKYLWPIGFRATRPYYDVDNPASRVIYASQIVEGEDQHGTVVPRFRVCCTGMTEAELRERPETGTDQAWAVLMRRVACRSAELEKESEARKAGDQGSTSYLPTSVVWSEASASAAWNKVLNI